MSTYDNFFYPLMLIFNIAPLFDRSQNSKTKLLYVLYFGYNFVRFLILVLCLTSFGISIYVLFIKHNVGIYTLLIASGSCQGTIAVIFLWHWGRKDYLRKFVQLIKINHEDKPFLSKINLKPLFILRNAVIGCFCVFLILSISYISLLTVKINSKDMIIESMFGAEENVLDHWCRKILLWGGFFQVIYFLLCLTVFLIFAFVLIHEFDCIRLMFASKLIFDYQYLKFVYSCHVNVCKILDLFNTIFKRFIFICYAVNIPFLIVILYYIVKHGGRYDNLTAVAVIGKFFIMILLQLVILSWIPASINQKAHKPLKDLYDVISRVEEANNEWYHLASIFANKLSCTQIGVTAWDMFIITKPVVLTTLSLIISYFTLLADVKKFGKHNNAGISANVSSFK